MRKENNMEWYSIIKIKKKETKQNGKYLNCYFVYDRDYIDKDKNPKSTEEWINVPKDIFDNYEAGNKVMLVRQDFWTRKNGEKKHFDFISECNPSK